MGGGLAYNVLIVGLGNIAMLYDYNKESITWTHVRALSQDPRFNIISAIDPNKNNRNKFHELIKCDVYSDLDTAIHGIDENIDIFVVSSPTKFHFENYKKILKYSQSNDCKMILMEKPLVDTDEELKDLCDNLKFSPMIMVNLFRLYQPQLNNYLSILSNNKNLDILVTFSKGILHNGIHFFTLLLRYFGECKSFECFILNDKKSFRFFFDKGAAIFTPSVLGVDENSLVIKSKIGSLYYLSGGRNSFFIDKDNNKHEFDVEEFNHYQTHVYNEVYEQLIMLKDNNVTDDSFSLAYSAQQWLSKIEKVI